ncbi:MAG: hypothetical protein P8X86_02615 [Desulfofustis sp.]
MKVFRVLMLIVFLGFLLTSCSGGSDDGGTTGGSGETQAAATNEESSSNDKTAKEESNEEPEEEPASVVSSSEIFIDAFDFNCSSNWGDRDGALGIKAYTGSGTCRKSFPGEAGTYQLVLKAVTEFDGKSPYKFSINGTQVASGEYPLSSSLGCDCPEDNWREVCPDRDRDIDLGTYDLNPGDVLELWGDDVYPCGSHGSYTKWRGIEAIRR